jgi:PII-like signaling protein
VTGLSKLSVYFAERERCESGLLAEAVVGRIAERGIAAGIVLRGLTSFGLHDILRTDQSLTLSEDLPIVVTAVDSPDVIEALAADTAPWTTRALVTVEHTLSTAEDTVGTVRFDVHLRRQQRVDGGPAYRAVCEVLHRLGFAGAAVFLGVDGTVAGERRRARFFSRNVDVPMLVSAVGTSAQAALARAELAAVPGVQTTRPVQATPAGGDGLQRLTVLTNEDTLHDGVPVHRALVRSLREGRAVGGATVLRGLWGFVGAQAPRGDSMLRVARRVPVATVVVGTAAQVSRAFEIANTLAQGRGVIICEDVSSPQR